MSINLTEHEEMFELKPIGIRYRCEFCNDGEMIASNSETLIVEYGGGPYMRTHTCNKCGKSMKLPKTYPYIEWVTPEEYDSLMITDNEYNRRYREENGSD